MKALILIPAILFTFVRGYSQCPDNNIFAGSATTVPDDTSTYGSISPGEYISVYLEAGNAYGFRTNPVYNTMITVYDMAGTSQAWNDDWAGIGSFAVFSPTLSGVYKVLLDSSGCQHTGTPLSMDIISVDRTGCSSPVTPDSMHQAIPVVMGQSFCGITYNTYTPDTYLTSFCSGLDHSSWLSFTPLTSAIRFDGYVPICLLNQGIQLSVYNTSDGINFVPVGNCLTFPASVPDSIHGIISGLTPGETHYLAIDGMNDAVCEFSFNLSNHFSVHPASLLCLVGVDQPSNKNYIIYNKLSPGTADHYNIYRETTIFNQFELIGAVPDASPAYFEDINANPSLHSWRYKVFAVTITDSVLLEAYPHKTIFLMAVSQGNQVNLSWEHYNNCIYPLAGSYIIYKGSDPSSLLPLDSVSSSSNHYLDTAPSSTYYAIGYKPLVPCYYSFKSSATVGLSNAVHVIVSDNFAENIQPLRAVPNPFGNELTITGDFTEQQILTIQLTDITGRQIQTVEKNYSGSGITLKTDNIPPGIYILSVLTPNKVLRGTVIRE